MTLSTMCVPGLKIAVGAPVRDHLRKLHPSMPSPQESLLSSRIEGDYKGAVRLACSKDTFAPPNCSTIKALESKHPPPHPDTSIPSIPAEVGSTLEVSQSDVLQALLSFPKGSAGGPDCLCPQHLGDMTSKSVTDGGQLLLQALTAFVNFVLSGRVHVNIRPSFFGATLLGLNKRDGGIRPIAIGCTLRRLVAKVASRRVVSQMETILSPLQLGYATPLGAEAAIHSARQYLMDLPADYDMVKLNFRNAFNSVRRDKVWRQHWNTSLSFTLLFTVVILLHLTSSSTIPSCSLKKECSKVILSVPSCSVLCGSTPW